MRFRCSLSAALLCVALSSNATVPPPPVESEMFPWNVGWGANSPGAMDASSLNDKPAGANGPVVVKDGHFYTGSKRLRFWGINVCFSGNFPAKDQADVVAKRLAALGFNIVRFHHMDSATWPNGLMKDNKTFDLHPEALDRLDYFVAALKREGIYSNINLRVGRQWSKVLGLPNADKVPYQDKVVDLFTPELIEAQKRYAKDLLHHVNPYTKTTYAEEPAVAMVEINNENTFFYWGGEDQLAKLPEPYATTSQGLWNKWLTKKYPAREALVAAWADGATAQANPANLLKDTEFATLNKPKSAWVVEKHAPADMSAVVEGAGVKIEVKKVDGTDWHLQFNQPGLALKAGQFYTLAFKASATKALTISAAASMAHAPWQNLGLQRNVQISTEPKEYRLGFTATKDDTNGRVSLTLGDEVATITLSDLSLREGGREGLRAEEDSAKGNVARSGSGSLDTQARIFDWYRFLQETDENYFVSMKTFLQTELAVKAPICGTIGLGMLGTKAQSKMDFVDAHTYWDHPTFPGGKWSTTNYKIHNKPAVDEPNYTGIWTLTSTRVEGKPFTVTEYNHAAPNEWQADTVPMIAAYAGMQDWDALFLFSYAHGNKYEHNRTTGFFDFEGNPLKMAHLATGARLFHRTPAVQSTQSVPVSMADILPKTSSYYYEQRGFMADVMGIGASQYLTRQVKLRYVDAPERSLTKGDPDTRLRWTASGPGTGQFALVDPTGVAFAGFIGKAPVDLGAAKIEASRTPYLTLTLVPADAGQTIESAPRLLLSVAARGTNTGAEWTPDRHTATKFGTEPALVEHVDADLSIAGKPVKVYALDGNGVRGTEVPTESRDGRTVIKLGAAKTLWFEMVRE